MILAYIALVLIGFVWGSNYIFIKLAAEILSPMQIVFVRLLSGFIPLLLIAWRTGALDRSQIKYLTHFFVMSILASSFYFYCFVSGTALLPSSVAGLIGGTIPIVTFLTSVIFLRSEKLNAIMALGIALGFIGIVITARPWNNSATISTAGVLWVLAGAISVGSSFVYARRFLAPLGLKPVALATWQTGLAFLTLIFVTDPTGITNILDKPYALAALVLGLGVFGTGLAYLTYYYMVEKLGAVGASSATYLPVVVAMGIGFLIGENITIVEIEALILILGGVALIQIGAKRGNIDK